MALTSLIGGVVSGIVAPVARIFEKRESRKKAVETIRAKTAQAKQAGETQVQLDIMEWEALSKRAEPETWKDEFVTVVVFAPFITMLIGSLAAAFGHTEMAQASAAMLIAINNMNIDYGTLLYVTVGAALGVRLWKG